MATQNATITTAAWTKIADTADQQVLIQAPDSAEAAAQGEIQYSLVSLASEGTPDVLGHRLYGSTQAASRAVLGSGHIYARLDYSSEGASSALLVVSGSSESLS